MPTSKHQLSPHTIREYASYERRFREYLDGQQPTLENATAFLEHLARWGLKENSIFVAGHAIRRNLGIQVPVPKFSLPEPEYLTTDQVNALIDHSETILERTLFTVMFDTGCRISEMLDLHLSDLHLETGVARVTRKGGQKEEISLGQESVQALEKWLSQRKSDDDRVFMDHTYITVRYLFKRVAHKIGLKGFHSHLLRHTRARQLYDAGVPMERISEILGHRSLDTTMKIYARFKAEDRAKYMDKVAPWRR